MKEQFTIEERAKFLHDTIAAQRKFLAQQRSEAIRNKPPTKNQLRNQMMTYLMLFSSLLGLLKMKRWIKKLNEKGVDLSKSETDQAEHIEEINQNVVIRSNGQKRYFSTLMRVLSIFDREDLNAVYQLVMDRFQDEIPEGFSRVLWGDLMVMFNPDDENDFWIVHC
ncbi:hypothetical protein Tco_0790735 [Tanacetum coccineum]